MSKTYQPALATPPPKLPPGWIRREDNLPPDGVAVETCISDERGTRNIQPLKRQGNLWFFADGSMYVYYTPTHWRWAK